MTIPDLFNYWLSGRARVRVHGCDDDAVCRRVDANVGDAAAVRDRSAHSAAAAARRSRVRCSARFSRPLGQGVPALRSSLPACHDTASAVASVCGGRSVGVHQLGNVVAARHRAPRARHHGEGPGSELHQRGRRRRDDAAAEEHRRPVAAAVVPPRAGPARVSRSTYADVARGRRRRAPRVPLARGSGPSGVPQSGRYAVAIADVLPADRAARADHAAGVRAGDPRKPGIQVPPGPRSARGCRPGAVSRKFESSAADRGTVCSISSRRTRPAGPSPQDPWKRPRSETSPCRCWRRAPFVAGRRAAVIERSFPVERFDRSAADRWDAQYLRFPITWSSRVPETRRPRRSFCRTCGTSARPRRCASDPLELLRYRSNLLGADLRITNFGGGNTSSKFELPDPLTGRPVRVMAVKGSGGDLRSMDRSGFAILYLDKLEALIPRYRGEALRRRDGRPLSAVCVRREPRGRRRSIRRSTRSCHSTTSIICTRTGRLPWPRARTARRKLRGVQRSGTAGTSSGFRGSGLVSNWR